AGIAAGLQDLAANGGEFAAHIDQLIDIGRALWPACCAVATLAGAIALLMAGVVLLARGLQSGA
ncbi:MAG: hypothetical protein ACOCVP_04685, partial [Wenzhouxiangella sp.]